MRIWIALAVVLGVFAGPTDSIAQPRCAVPHGAGASLPVLRQACPPLAAFVEAHAMRDLGEAFEDESLRARGHDKVPARVIDDVDVFAVDALRARAAGAVMADFGEALYLTAAARSVPKAVAAMRVLLEIFPEQAAACATSSLGPASY